MKFERYCHPSSNSIIYRPSLSLKTYTMPPYTFHDLPPEIFDIIALYAVELPITTSSTLPHYFPLLFPKNPQAPGTNLYDLTLAHPKLTPAIMKMSWPLVVVSVNSHVKNILDMRPTHRRQWFCKSTTRCEIFLPILSPTPDLDHFLHRFINLQTLVWEFPPLSFFRSSITLPQRSLTTLQIATLPSFFNAHNLIALSDVFPALTHLQVLDTPFIDSSPRFTLPDDPILPNLTHLAVGVPWHFLPGEPYHRNTFLDLLTLFPKHSAIPNLTHLAVELHADISEDFIEQHCESLTTIAFGSGDARFFDEDLLLAPPEHLRTIVLHLDADSLDFPELPLSITRIVLLQPFLPQWRTILNLHNHLSLCLDRIYTLPDNSVTEVLCEKRSAMSPSFIESQTERFAAVGVSFSVFDFSACHLSASSTSQSFILHRSLVSQRGPQAPVARYRPCDIPSLYLIAESPFGIRLGNSFIASSLFQYHLPFFHRLSHNPTVL